MRRGTTIVLAVLLIAVLLAAVINVFVQFR